MFLHESEAKGRVIAAARIFAGLDQTELAVAAGLSPSTISNVERGRINARPATLRAIQKVLKRDHGVSLQLDSVNSRMSVTTNYSSLDF